MPTRKYSAALHRQAIRPTSIPKYRSLRLSADQPAHLPVKRCQTFTIWWFLLFSGIKPNIYVNTSTVKRKGPAVLAHCTGQDNERKKSVKKR